MQKNFQKDEIFVSFSGGKDSTVVADLVRRSLDFSPKEKLLHLFGDTTLEFPYTLEYVKQYKKTYRDAFVRSSKNKDKNFEELCQIIGPPSRVMRWCCTIFKTGAINRQIESMFKNKTKIVSFQGIRRSEVRQVEANMKELPKIPRLESSKRQNRSLTGMTLMSGSIF